MGLVGFLYTNKTPFHERKDYSFLEDPTLLISILFCFFNASVVVGGGGRRREDTNGFPLISPLYFIYHCFFPIIGSSIDLPLLYLTIYAKLEFDPQYNTFYL